MKIIFLVICHIGQKLSLCHYKLVQQDELINRVTLSTCLVYLSSHVIDWTSLYALYIALHLRLSLLSFDFDKLHLNT